MASQYSIIQYVPNPIADERINIGVLVFDEQSVRVHFLQSWDRVRCFGLSEDIDFLKNFAHEMDEVTKEGLLFPGDRPTNIPAHERLVRVARGWKNGIQFTEPRGSLAGVDLLLDELAHTYLLEPLKNSELPMHKNIELQSIKDKDSITKIYTALKPILEERFNTSLRKSVCNLIRNNKFKASFIILNIISLLVGSILALLRKTNNIIFSLCIIFMIFSLLVFIIYFCYFGFISKKKAKDKLPTIEQLIQSTFEYGMIPLEKSYLPD